MELSTAINECAFSGSLCRIQKFETVDGMRYCLTIFSLSDYKHLHFPHDEYKWLIDKLYTLHCMQTKVPTVATIAAGASNLLTISNHSMVITKSHLEARISL